MAPDTVDGQPSDYHHLIDAETWAFIDKTNRFYPTDTHQRSIMDQRRIYDEMCAAFARGYPDGVTSADYTADTVPVRIYQRANGQPGVTVLYAHGGGFVVGGLHSHDDICAEICAGTGMDVVAIDYRMAPDFTRQDALADMQGVLEWARRTRGGRFVCVGDSAGGNLVAGLVHLRRNDGDILGQVLIYPGLGFFDGTASLDRHAFAPMLTREEVLSYQQIMHADIWPARGGDFSGLPVTVAMAAECDPLADHARLYADAITGVGGNAIWFEDKGLVHGHLRARHSVARARQSFDRVLRAIRLIGTGLPFTKAAIEGRAGDPLIRTIRIGSERS